MANRLRGKVVIVTGGYGLIGSGICRVCADEGARVVVAGRSADAADRLAGEIAAGGGEAVGAGVDVSSLGDTERMASIALDRFGAIDGLVCGAIWQEMGNALELSE